VTNPLDQLLDDPTLDSIFSRDQLTLSDDELKRLVSHFRAERAMWEDKQLKKGKVE